MSVSQVIIAGAGGFGRELCCWLKQSKDFNERYHLAGFIDDNKALIAAELPIPWLGTIQSYKPEAEQLIAVGIGNPAPRKAVVERLRSCGANFLTFVHPSVIIGERVKLGTGCIICPGCILTCDITVGDFCLMNLGVTVGHDVRIGPFCSIFSQIDICGGVTIGSEVTMGSGSRIVPGVKVGDQAKIGAGSVVFGNVRTGVTVIGNPAKVFR